MNIDPNVNEDRTHSAYLLSREAYKPIKPSPTENLTELYGLTELCASVARVDDAGEKRKLRKSYKGHVADLPGKITLPEDNYLQQLLNKSNENPPLISQLEQESLKSTIGLLRVCPIPGFDTSVLGLEDFDEEDRDSTASPGGRKTKKRKSEHDHRGKKKKRA